MREWYAIFADDPRRTPELIKMGAIAAPAFNGFREAAAAGTYNGRALRGMYIIDPVTPQCDVVAWCGSVPHKIGWFNTRTIRFDLKGLTPTARLHKKAVPQQR